MSKLIGLLLWLGGFLGGFLCWGSYVGDNTGKISVSYLIFMAVLLLLSGIGRRIFGLNKAVIEKRGIMNAILSRIHCLRFYFSIIWYTALAYASFCLKVVADEGEGILRFGLACLVCLVVFFFVRRTCPRCGVKLSWDGDEDDTTINVKYDDTSNSITAKQGYTEHYHCRRCGRRVRIRKTKTVGQVNFK